jgi:hypothetical protein
MCASASCWRIHRNPSLREAALGLVDKEGAPTQLRRLLPPAAIEPQIGATELTDPTQRDLLREELPSRRQQQFLLLVRFDDHAFRFLELADDGGKPVLEAPTDPRDRLG